MSEEKPFRIVSEKPLIAMTLREREPVLPRPLRDWWLGWLQEIESMVRNTDFIAGTAAYIGSMLIAEAIRKGIMRKR